MGGHTPDPDRQAGPPENAGACWICRGGNGPHDTGLVLDMDFDAYVHQRCLDEHGCDDLLEYETRETADEKEDETDV